MDVAFEKNMGVFSPNEPLTKVSIDRMLSYLERQTNTLLEQANMGSISISLWSPNVAYSKGQLAMYFQEPETEQVASDIGLRQFVFILMSTKDGINTSMPNYDLVNGVPDFSKSGWVLLNPLSYLLQDLQEMRQVVKEVFTQVLDRHLKVDHGLSGSSDIERNLLKKDFSNLVSQWDVKKYSLSVNPESRSNGGYIEDMKRYSNGVMEYFIEYSLDAKANQYLFIEDGRYYRQKSPIVDESDNAIFSQLYSEDDSLFSVKVNGTTYSNLRYGTNVFSTHISFSTESGRTPFVNDEYMVFFDTYGNGEFVFGYDKLDIQEKTEPTYDSIVSMPMLMNKAKDGFDIVLPIHTYFNSMQKYQIGVPWNNRFRLQAVGMFR